MEATEEILKKENILVNLPSESKEEAIRRAGGLLQSLGYVNSNYTNGMLARENVHTTYLDNEVAIPHGVEEVKHEVIKAGIVVLLYPNGIDYGDGNTAKLLIGIAAQNNEHIDVISKLAIIIDDEQKIADLISSNDVETVYGYLK